MSLAVNGALGTLKRVLADKGKPVVLIIETNDRRVTSKTLGEFQMMQERPVRFSFEVNLTAEDSQLSLDDLPEEDREEAKEQIEQAAIERAEAVAKIKWLNPDHCDWMDARGTRYFVGFHKGAEPDAPEEYRVWSRDADGLHDLSETIPNPAPIAQPWTESQAQALLNAYGQENGLMRVAPTGYGAVYGPEQNETEEGCYRVIEREISEDRGPEYIGAFIPVTGSPDLCDFVYHETAQGAQDELDAYAAASKLPLLCYQELPGERVGVTEGSVALTEESDPLSALSAYQDQDGNIYYVDHVGAAFQVYQCVPRDPAHPLAFLEIGDSFEVTDVQDALDTYAAQHGWFATARPEADNAEAPSTNETAESDSADQDIAGVVRIEYADSGGNVYRISQGLGKGDAPWFTVKVKAGETGEHRVKSTNLPDRDRWERAQLDLDAYAVNHGLETVTVVEETPAADVEEASAPPAEPEPSGTLFPPPLSEIVKEGDTVIRLESKRIPGIDAKPVPVVKVDRDNKRITTRAGFVSFPALDEGYRIDSLGPGHAPAEEPSAPEEAPDPNYDPFAEGAATE